MVPFFVHRLAVRVVAGLVLAGLGAFFAIVVEPRIDARPAELRDPPGGVRVAATPASLFEVTGPASLKTSLGPVKLAGIRPATGRCTVSAKTVLFRTTSGANLWLAPAGTEYDAHGVRHDQVWAGEKVHVQARLVALGLARPDGSGRWAVALQAAEDQARRAHRGMWGHKC
jgi:hypothetical protein